jgi:hypothetical protein
LAVLTPARSSILAIEPCSGSNSSASTFDQPPRSSIVFSVLGVGNLSSLRSSTVSSTGR